MVQILWVQVGVDVAQIADVGVVALRDAVEVEQLAVRPHRHELIRELRPHDLTAQPDLSTTISRPS